MRTKEKKREEWKRKMFFEETSAHNKTSITGFESECERDTETERAFLVGKSNTAKVVTNQKGTMIEFLFVTTKKTSNIEETNE